MSKRCFKNILVAVLFAAIPLLNGNLQGYAQELPAKDIEQLDFANGLFERGLYDMAIVEYKEFINRFPQSEYLSDAYFGIAESLFISEHYQEAADAYSRHIELFPEGQKKAVAALRLGESFFFAGQYDKARETLLSVSPGGLEESSREILYFYLGKTSQVKGARPEALEYFKKAGEGGSAGKYAVFALLEIGDILAEDSDYTQAGEYYDRAFQGAGSDDVKSLAMFKQGEAQFLLGNYGKAIDIFRKTLEQYPKQTIAQDSLTNLLLASFNIFRYEDVVSEYLKNKERIADEEQFFDVHYIAARAYFQLAKYEEAVALLDKILTFKALSEEDRHKVLFKKAEVFIKAGRLKEAVALIEGNLEQLPLDKDYVIFLKAEAYYGLEDFEKTYALYKRVVDEFPSSSFADNALYGMAHVQNSLEKFREAMDLFFKYFETGKDEAKRREALYNEILIGSRMDLVERTIEHSETYLSAFAEDAREEKICFLLGTLYPKVNRHDKAVDVLKRFVAKFGESEKLQEAYFLLAYNLQLAGRSDEALEYYEKVAGQKDEEKLHYPALKNTALIYLNKENDDLAINTYDRIITEFKENDLGIKTYLWLAERYIENKKSEDALRILANGEEKFSGPQEIQGITYFKAEAFRKARDFKKAGEHYDIVLSMPQENAYSGAAHIGKGLCLIEEKDYDAAKKEFETAIRENTDDNTITMRARFEIGNIEQLTDHPEEAHKFYMLVAVLYQDDFYCPEALFRAGEIFEGLDKKEEALNVYQEIVSGYGQSHLLEKARERIKALSAN